MESNQKPSLIKDLWDRRFFQFFATYLGAGWAFIQFSEWLVKRYAFNDSLVDRMALFLLMCLPAFLIFVYNHGRPGPDDWKPFEKFFIPINLVIAAGISFFVISSTAAPKTEVVSIQTEEGDTITRVVPGASYTNRFVIFPFENETGDKENDWLRMGLPYLLDKDLEQDMRVFSMNPISLIGDYKDIGKSYEDNIPFAAKIKMAKDAYVDYFIVGKYGMNGEKYTLEAEVYNSTTGKSFFKNSFESDSYYGVVDKFNEDLMNNVYLEEFESGEQVIDLPSQDLISSKPEALKELINGRIYLRQNFNKPELAEPFFKKATEIDPDCAECYSSLGFSQRIQMNLTEAVGNYQKALDLSSYLPERQKLDIQQSFYYTNQEPAKATILLQTWMKLYPSDYTPFSNLLDYYSVIQELDKAKEIGELAIKNGHQGLVYIRLAQLYMNTGDLDKAENYLENFAKQYPHKANEVSQLADIYFKKGELAKAKDHLEKINILKPSDVPVILRLGNLEEKMGNFDVAMKRYDEALRLSEKPQDSVNTYFLIEKFYERNGQISKEIELQEIRLNLMRTYLPAISVDLGGATSVLQMGYRYPLIGREQEYREIVDNMINSYKTDNPAIVCVCNVMYYMFTEDKENFRIYYDKCKDVFVQGGGGNIEYLMEATYLRMDEKYEESSDLYKRYIDSTGMAQIQFGHQISEVFRKAGKIKEAREYIDLVMKEDPTQSLYLLELARVEHAEGDTKKAKETLAKSLEYWKDADPNYKYLLEAKEFQKSLE